MANEKRLIDANALLRELEKFENPMPNKSGYDFLCGIATAITEIEDAPTVDAVEVVHGRWIGREEKLWNLDMPIVTMWECSVCGMSGGYYEYNYCPNCGAKMDGGNEDV